MYIYIYTYVPICLCVYKYNIVYIYAYIIILCITYVFAHEGPDVNAVCRLLRMGTRDFDSEFAVPKALGADVHLTDAWARLQLKLGHTTLGSS